MPEQGHDHLAIVGYSDPLSAAPGETVRFMVSSARERYRATAVRLIHGDDDPAGPGFKEEPVPGLVDCELPGRRQHLPLGSYVRVPGAIGMPEAFTIQAFVFATAPGSRLQGIAGRLVAEAGYALVLDDDGAPSLVLGAGAGRVQRVSTGVALDPRRWYFVSASVDAAAGTIVVHQRSVGGPPHARVDGARADATLEAVPADAVDAPFLVAALGAPPTAHFNGKIDSPRILGGAVEADDLDLLAAGLQPDELGISVIAAWDFSKDISSARVTDAGPHELHGEAVNAPLRAATGWNWSGDETCWSHAPEQYGAIHFHDDDLADACWDVDLELTLPAGTRSGVYALKLETDDGAVDRVPFVVRPPRGAPTAPVALLLPTLSYVVYANEHLSYQNPRTPPAFDGILDRLAPEDSYVRAERLLSCYDHHSDGSGVVYASWRRPLVTMRPLYDLALIDAPHQFSADLHLVDWLEESGQSYDVITDHDLHAEGLALLDGYRVVVSGSHPEYWTTAMLDALESYLGAGGRFMYLGGNGFCWVTAVDPERPYLAELRRGRTDGAIWESEPGQCFHSTTGELGGFWPRRGRGFRTVGVWFTAQGFDRSHPYRREAGSFDPRASWIFDGVGDEPIGDFGLVMGGAAGFEIDRLDAHAGSPPHALLLASAREGFSESYDGLAADWLQEPYQRALQEKLGPPGAGEAVQYARSAAGPSNPLVRSDMVFFETPHGGAVFSTGSIAWCGALSHNGYDNNVSRITGNVLRRFAADGEVSG
ncbi:MAG TPA: N,N-dimethylformamidase beta subunit family domain-containing protein [Gaiellaceae bacterium]